MFQVLPALFPVYLAMKKLLRILLIFLSTVLTIYLTVFFARKWTVIDKAAQMNTAHFRIHYQGIYRGEAAATGKILEANYERINAELGNADQDNIDVYIYPNQQQFNEGTGLENSTANGTSRGPQAFHFIWTNWFNGIFPDDPLKTALHEFTHCVQLNILIKQALKTMNTEDDQLFNEAFEKKFSESYPQWFWEAICTYEAQEVNSTSIKYAMEHRPTLKTLNNSNQVYLLGYSIIDYITQKWGKEKLPELITSWVDLEKVLDVSVDEFEDGWYAFVEKNY